MRNMKNKLVEILTLSSFLLNSVAIAAPGVGIESVPFQAASEVTYENLLSKLIIPQELGTVKERFIGKGDPSSPSPVVVHIEDAHAKKSPDRDH